MGFDLIKIFLNCVCYYNYYNLTTIEDPKNWNWKKLAHRSILEEKKNNGGVCIEGGWWAQWGKEKNFILNSKYLNVVQSIEFWLTWIINGGGGIVGKLGMMLCKKARNTKGGGFSKKHQEMIEQKILPSPLGLSSSSFVSNISSFTPMAYLNSPSFVLNELGTHGFDTMAKAYVEFVTRTTTQGTFMFVNDNELTLLTIVSSNCISIICSSHFQFFTTFSWINAQFFSRMWLSFQASICVCEMVRCNV